MQGRCVVWCFVWCLAGTATVSAEVLDRADAGLKVQNEAVVAADAQTAWNAFVRNVNDWWQIEHHWFGAHSRVYIDERAGGCFCEIGPGNQQAVKLTVTYVRPFEEIRLAGAMGPFSREGASGSLILRFIPENAGTRLVWTYSVGGYTQGGFEKWADDVDAMQGTQLRRLAKYINTGSPE